MKIASRLPLIVAILSAAGLAISGFGVRQNWWTYRLGFQGLEWSAYCGLAAAALALLALAIPRIRKGAWVVLLPSLLIGLTIAYLP